MVHYHVLNDSIVLNFSGKTRTVSKGDKRFEDVLAAIRERRLDDIPSIVDVEKAFEGSGIELKDGLLYEGDSPMPAQLSDRILKFKELGLPFDALLKFWDNLKKNPSYNSREQLFKFLEHNGHPITEDGCFIAYRGVTGDFKDPHTKTFDNSVGSVCEMPRSEVDDNPNNTCSRGLHVACHNYAKGFGARLIEVKVNPADVVCVPTDYNGTKMRTCKFEVVAEGENERQEQIYGKPDPSQEVVGSEDHEAAPEEEEEEEENEDECPMCGADRDPFHTFCPECGHEF